MVHNLNVDGPPSHLLLTADDRVLLAGIGGKSASIHAWDMDMGAEIAQMGDSSLKPANGDNNSQSRSGITGLALSGDERFLAVVSSWEDVSELSVWETGSWQLLRAFALTSPTNLVKAMVFSRNGRSLFVANSDSTILEWDVANRWKNGQRSPADETLNRDRLNVLWRTLSETPDKAYPAVWELLDHPAESVPFLIDKLSPVKPVEEKRVRKLLVQLDSESFAEREEANRQLMALGEQVVPLLHQTLKERLSLEVRKRVEGVLEALKRAPTSEQLRLLRALAVLEWSNRPEAVDHLRRLADGAPSALLTQTAKAAWRRRSENP